MLTEVLEFDPRKLPAELRAAIGLMAACAAQTESILEDAIAGLLGVDAERGMAITTHMAAPLRMSVLRSAAEIRLELDDLHELDDILADIERATEKRNDAIHAIWCVNASGETSIVKRKARTEVDMQLSLKTVDEVEREALVLYEVGLRLIRFLAIRGLIPDPAPFRSRGHKSHAARKNLRKKTLSRS